MNISQISKHIIPRTEWVNTYSFQYDGSDERIDFGNSVLGFTSSDNFSISAWIKPITGSVYQQFIGRSGSTAGGILIRINNDNTLSAIVQDISGNAANAISASTVTLNVWQHVGLVYTASTNTVEIFLQGSLDGSASNGLISGNLFTASNNFLLGARYKEGIRDLHFAGLIDEVTIWNTNLNGTDMSNIYNSGVPARPLSHAKAGNLMYWINMEASVYNGSIWTVVSSYGSLSGSSENMELGDRSTDIP